MWGKSRRGGIFPKRKSQQKKSQTAEIPRQRQRQRGRRSRRVPFCRPPLLPFLRFLLLWLRLVLYTERRDWYFYKKKRIKAMKHRGDRETEREKEVGEGGAAQEEQSGEAQTDGVSMRMNLKRGGRRGERAQPRVASVMAVAALETNEPTQ